MNKPVFYGLLVVMAVVALVVFSGKSPGPTSGGIKAVEGGRTPGDQKVRLDNKKPAEGSPGPASKRSVKDQKTELVAGSGKGGGNGKARKTGAGSLGIQRMSADKGDPVPVYVDNEKKGEISSRSLENLVSPVSFPFRSGKRTGWDLEAVLEALGVQPADSVVFHGRQGEPKALHLNTEQDGLAYFIAFNPGGKLQLYSGAPSSLSDGMAGGGKRGRNKDGGSAATKEVGDVVKIEVRPG